MAFCATEEQLEAINHDGGDALVFAAAGSGKTRVLTERVMRLLQTPSDDDKILPKYPAASIVVVTYTKKAVAELRARIEASVSALLTANPDSTLLSRQAARLSSMTIATIHAFCLDIIRQNADVTKQPAFVIMDDDENKELSEQALRTAMDILYDGETFHGEEREALLSAFGGIGDADVAVSVRELARALEAQPDPEAWLEQIRKLWTDEADSADWKQRLIDSYLENIAAGAANLIAKIDMILPEASGTKNYDLLENMREKLLELSAISDFSDFSGADKTFFGKETFSWKGLDADFVKRAQTLVKKIKAFPAEAVLPAYALTQSFPLVIADRRMMIAGLIKLYRVYDATFTELKRRSGKIYFSDIERMCLVLLRQDDCKLAAEIGAAFSEIIVDEFQDSNSVQYTIFALLSLGGARLFFVGDVKQSVYGFRGADPSVFTKLASDSRFTVLRLSKNFRSANPVIDAVNAVCDVHMNERVGGVAYTGGERLVHGLDSDIAGYAAERCVISKDADFSEADYVAARIRQLVDSGILVTDNGERRPVAFSDIAILSSSLAGDSENELITALENYQIPAARSKSANYLAVSEIAVAADLLSVIDDPYRDVELFHVLTSPIYHMTIAEIARFRTKRPGIRTPLFSDLSAFAREKRRVSVYTYTYTFKGIAGKYRQTGSLKISALIKARRFLANHTHFCAVAMDGGVAALIREVIDGGCLDNVIASSKFPEKALANFRLLPGYCSGATSLSQVRRYLHGRSLPEADVGGGNAVGIYTIHASKGLEFPVVFLINTAKRFNLEDEKGNILFDRAFGPAPQYIDSRYRLRYETLPYTVAKQNIAAGRISEEIRKLYVAMTRAQQMLIITGKSGESGYAQWLGVLRTTDVTELPSDVSVPVLVRSCDILSKEHIITEPELYKTYGRSPLTLIPKKLTATGVGIQHNKLLETEDEPSVFPRMPSFFKENSAGNLTGKKRGDAYHKAMLLIDFAAGDYETQLLSLKQRFTAEAFDCIKASDITGFFSCELGRRAVKSRSVKKEFPIFAEADFARLGFPELDAKYPGQKPLVQGIADMFFVEDGGVILVDYKTNRHTTAEKLREEYKGQLEIYSRAISEMTGLPVRECWLYSFEIGAVKI